MNDDTIKSLLQALELSPDNGPLRMLLADTYFALGRYDEAEREYTTYLSYHTGDSKAKKGLLKSFFHRGNYSAAIVIIEDLKQSSDPIELDIETLYAKALYREGSIGKAQEVYQSLMMRHPGFTDEELDKNLKLGHRYEDEMSGEYIDDFRFLEKPTINFSDVGGMDHVKKEIDLKIIKPIEHAELYRAYGKKTGGGILLYGPPGCGKTFIAKATAGQVNAKFISVGLNDILDMWIGNSEKNLHEIFELGRHHTPCVIFIDEIDALGANRNDMKQSGGRNLINQFLTELDGIDHNNDGLLIIGATNAPWNLDPAFRRPGRFDRIIFVPPPDHLSRENILKLKLQKKPVENIDYYTIAKSMDQFSGADIEAVIDIAIESKLESAFIDGIPKPINTVDIHQAIKKHKASTQEWFMTAKNYALFANDAGLYDDVLQYINVKK
jgi:transitional endoplasmic reticulum ATPase